MRTAENVSLLSAEEVRKIDAYWRACNYLMKDESIESLNDSHCERIGRPEISDWILPE